MFPRGCSLVASFTSKWRRCCRETGLDPACLELEVTESAVMDDPEVALEQMHRLRELGVCLAIDDFGTGLLVLAATQALASAEAQD